MAYVTLDDLRQKGVTGATYNNQFNSWNVSGGSKADQAYYAELVRQAQGLMESLGVKPDAVSSFSTDSGDFSKPYYSSALIERTLNERGLQMGVDPSRSSGKLGGSGSWTLQMGLLDSSGNPVQEFQTGEGSIGSSFFKGFVAPFASMILTGNTVANLISPGAVAAAGGIDPSVIGQTLASGAPEAVQSAITGAVVSGSITALSGGDAEDVIKNALVSGAVAGVAELAAPYVQDAIDFVKDLTPEGLENVVAAAEGAGDVAGNVADVDVGGAVLPTTTDVAMQAYDNAIAAGLSHQEAMNAAFAEVDAFTGVPGSNELSGFSPAANALAGTGATAGAVTGATNALTSGTVVPVNAGGVSDTLSTGMQEELGLTGAYTGGNAAADAALGLGAAGTAAGVAGAGAAGAGSQMTAADLEGLDPDLTLGGGTDVLGGTDVGGGTGAIVTGAAGGAGAGDLTLGGGTETAATGRTGIPVVDDFLAYLGTAAGAATLSALGSVYSGYQTAQAAKDAAQIQADSAANALKLQREQFEYQKELLDPYRRRGEAALNRLAGVMGLDGQPAQPQQLLEMDPGYAFRLGEGMKALERVQAARGNMLSGGAIKAGQRYAQDFASGEYGNAYNRLANIAGLGQTVGGQLGTAAQQFGQTAGETMSQGANALAAGRINRTSGYMGGIGGAVGAYQNYQNQQQQNQLFGKFLDIYGRAVGAGG